MNRPLAYDCPNCNAPLQIPAGRQQFFCQFCGTSLTVPRTPATARRGDSDSGQPKPLVPIPEKLRVQELGRDLRISWRWFQPAILFLVPFCIAWNSFLVGWYSIAAGSNGPPGAFKIIFVLFPIGHVAVGLGLLYVCLVGILNRTTIDVTRGTIRVSHGPLPGKRGRTLSIDDVDQLYVKRNGDAKSYSLVAQLDSRHKIKLLPKQNDATVARAVEQLIESHLGIDDRTVPGEHDT